MKTIINDIVENTKMRISNPFVGTFILAWITVNWKPILYILLSNHTIETKIINIESEYSSYRYLLFIPLLVSILYVIVIPYFMWIIEGIVEGSINGRNRLMIKRRIKELEGKKELAIKENQLEEVLSDYRELSELNTKIGILNGNIKDRDIKIKDLYKELDMLTEENLELQKIIGEIKWNKKK